MSAAIPALLAELRTATAALVIAHERGQREDVEREFAEAQRTLDALAPLLSIAAPAPKVLSFVPPPVKAGKTCPACGEKLTLLPSAGFGTRVSQLCGACGHDLAIA